MNSSARPADVYLPPHGSDVQGEFRAIDYTGCDPRSNSSIINSLSDKVPLAATLDAEDSKRRKHRDMLRSNGFNYESFKLVPCAFESSGAWSAQCKALWKELLAVYKSTKQVNYIRQGSKHTWAAFTFQQMIPQRLSFQVNYWSARGSIEAIRRSRAAGFVCEA